MRATFRSAVPEHGDIRRDFLRRRDLVRLGGAGILGLALPAWLAPRSLSAADAAPAEMTPLNRFPRMVQEYFVRRVREAQQAGDERRAAIKTAQDAERYVAAVRAKAQACFGPLPEKTPLQARITGVVEREAYRIEKVIFESRPGFLVTANLYLPKGRKLPLPGVIGTCGHSDNGKVAYQFFAQGLARLGYVVLIYDPIGQGERLQYPNQELKSRYGAGVREHLHGGNQQFLVGEFLGTWRAWDGIRALDYLLSRPEVDPKQVGITGNSGGGTMTTWLCALDDRWTMAAPSCFVTTFRRNLENELPADTEQCPPRALALGLDHSDFLAALAPKPIIILGQERDFFDGRGTVEAFERLKRLYALLGAEQNIALFVGPHPHGFSVENRKAMYRWFNRATGISAATTEPELVDEKDETLWCTPHGQVAELHSRTIFSYTREAARKLATERQALSGEALRRALAATLRLPEHRHVPDYRILRPISGRRYPKKHCTTYALQIEPGLFALVHMLSDAPHHSRPPQGIRRAVLYVAHHSSDAELREEPWIAELMAQETEAIGYACDVRGIGDSRPDTCGRDSFLSPYGSDYFYAIHALMLDEPYVGQKTRDVIGVLDWLEAQGCTEVHLAARGWGTLPATFAAVLSPLVTQVTLKNALTAYADVAETEDYRWPLSCLAPGVLREWDLPDCYRALAAKELRQIEPWGAMAEAVRESTHVR